MESRPSVLTPNATEPEFNVVQFEKKLTQLKDSQESINSLSSWCLEHRQHHKKIVNAWLNVLKKVKVEHRLTLFYLANDVIQYSKRKNYDFVESWGTTLQKATTMVREEKVKNRILRIFKIWEQRGIYGEEFITDLSGLISASPAARRLDQDPQDFQPQYLVNKIRSCAKLESDTDQKLKNLKESNLKITDSESLCASLKDRRHVEDVEHEVEEGIALIEAYVNALKSEIKSRTHLISVLGQADVFYHTERGDVKVVATAYKNFGTRVKNLKKKLDELIPTLNSPIPSPDVNAPSPEPDSDIDLPPHETRTIRVDGNKLEFLTAAGVTVYSITETYNAGYYNPAPATQDQEFSNNNFSSFIGTDFNMQNFNSSNSMFPNHQDDGFNMSAPPQDVPLHLNHETGPPLESPPKISYNYDPTNRAPLLPPPMPPFTTSGYIDNPPYTDPAYAPPTNTYADNPSYQPVTSAPYVVSSEIQNSYPPPSDAYNPEEEVETWEAEPNWDPSTLETPESPPMFEKEGFSDPIEYDDSKNIHPNLGKDVDHRVLLLSPPVTKHTDKDHRLSRANSKDVDHRNLISLVGGSPVNESPSILEPPPAPPSLWTDQADQDYRAAAVQDQDYRVPVDIAQQLKLPPPPPPPTARAPAKAPAKKCGVQDNVESIDMDLSDDDSSAAADGCGEAAAPLEPPPDAAGCHGSAKRGRFFGGGKRPGPAAAATAAGAAGAMQPPPPIPQNLCGAADGGAPDCELFRGPVLLPDPLIPPLLNEPLAPPPMPQMCEIPPQMCDVPPPPLGWQGDFFDGRPPDFQSRAFPPPPPPPSFLGRMAKDFRGSFRGEMFRGRGRGRGMWPRPPRGMGSRGPRGRARGFRGQFRGGF